MSKKNFVFGRGNFVILALAAAIIIIGFCLMSGVKTTEEGGFNPAIFDTRRIVIAPTVTLFGFIAVVFAIMWKPKDNDEKQ
ncbi:MAG: DUF3098 domain-containing protein [Dysgonamonadaceae bacterium]|jgi:hypothetical protein|nr:DUF3098 domain-containing protein [Dysgonamonadaceae bacterium]